MFDAPDNLPVEPNQGSGNTQPSQAPAKSHATAPQPQKIEGGINVSGTKEPEDIFADINEPAPPTPQTPAPNASPAAPKSSFPWKIVLGIGIPLLVIGLGVATYFVYQNYFAAEDGSLITDSGRSVAPTTVPATSEPSDEAPVKSPIPKPDEDKLAASQTSMELLKAQAEQQQAQVTSVGMMEEMMNAQTDGSAMDSMEPVQPENEFEMQDPDAPEMEIMESDEDEMVKMQPGTDTDADGLTNSEELLLGSDPNVVDSDADGFEDGSEVENGYDPALANATLAVSDAMKTEKIGLAIFALPQAWRRNPGPSGSVIIYTGTPASINISMQKNNEVSDLQNWLINNNQGSSATDYIPGNSMNGFQVVYSKDMLTAWLLIKDTVYTLEYTANGAKTMDFAALFNYMIKSATLAE